MVGVSFGASLYWLLKNRPRNTIGLTPVTSDVTSSNNSPNENTCPNLYGQVVNEDACHNSNGQAVKEDASPDLNGQIDNPDYGGDSNPTVECKSPKNCDVVNGGLGRDASPLTSVRCLFICSVLIFFVVLY